MAALKRVYVGSFTDQALTVIDADSNAALATIPLHVSPEEYPSSIAVDPVSRRVYAVTYGAVGSNKGSLWAIDAVSNSIISRIPLERMGVDVAVNSTTGRVYVSTLLSTSGDTFRHPATGVGDITVIDGRPTGGRPIGIVGHVALTGHVNGLAVDESRNRVFASVQDGNDSQGRVLRDSFVIVEGDTAVARTIAQGDIQIGTGERLAGTPFTGMLAVDERNDRVYVVTQDFPGGVLVIDPETGNIIHRAVTGLESPANPRLVFSVAFSVAIDARTSRAYVSLRSDDMVAVETYRQTGRPIPVLGVVDLTTDAVVTLAEVDLPSSPGGRQLIVNPETGSVYVNVAHALADGLGGPGTLWIIDPETN